MEIFRRAIGLEPSLPDTVLAQQITLAFLGRGAMKIRSDFLKSEYAVLTLSRDYKIYLTFFFKESGLFSERLAHILETYLLCQRSADRFAEYLSTVSRARNPEINVLVLVPEKLPAFEDMMKLIALPLRIVTYTSMKNEQGVEALLLDELECGPEDAGEPKVSKRVGIPEIAEEPPAQEEIKRPCLDVSPKVDFQASPLQTNEDENFFRRAKLNREEIRALLDLDLELDKIKG